VADLRVVSGVSILPPSRGTANAARPSRQDAEGDDASARARLVGADAPAARAHPGVSIAAGTGVALYEAVHKTLAAGGAAVAAPAPSGGGIDIEA